MSKNAQLDWDDLRYLLAVSVGGNLSRAAARLGVSHTTVSRRLGAFEDRLGTKLFHRTPGQLVLTEAGIDMLKTAERVEGEVAAAQRRVMGRDGQLAGPLRVSTLGLLYPLFDDALASFVREYPEVDVTLTTSLEPVSLLRRDADVAIRVSNNPPERLIGQRVGRMDCAVYASQGLVARVGDKAPLEAYPWLGMDRNLGQAHPDAWVLENVPNARVSVRVGEDPTMVHTLVQRGVGAYFVPVFLGQAMGLTALTPVIDAYGMDVWVLTLKELRQTGRVTTFLQAIGPAIRVRLGACRTSFKGGG